MKGLRSYLQANKWACCSFMDDARRYETPGSETKNFMTHGIASSMVISILVSVSLTLNFHSGNFYGPNAHLHTHWVGCTRERNPEFWEPESFIIGNKHICTLLQREPLSLLYWIVSMPELLSPILQGYLLYEHLGKYSLEQRQPVPLLAKCTEM